MPIEDAKKVAIELGKLNWELIDLSYRFEWDDPGWADQKAGESSTRKKTVEEWTKKKEQYMSSISRRVKYEALLGRVVAKDHLGRVPFKVVYDTEPVAGLDVNFRVLSAIPEGEVRVSEDTKLDLRESEKTW